MKDKPLSEKVFSNEDMDIIFRDDVAKFISDLLKQIKRRDLKDYVGLGFKGNIFDWIIKRAGDELANHSSNFAEVDVGIKPSENQIGAIESAQVGSSKPLPSSEDTNTKKKDYEKLTTGCLEELEDLEEVKKMDEIEETKKEIKLAKTNMAWHKKHKEYYEEQVEILEKYLGDLDKMIMRLEDET